MTSIVHIQLVHIAYSVILQVTDMLGYRPWLDRLYFQSYLVHVICAGVVGQPVKHRGHCIVCNCDCR